MTILCLDELGPVSPRIFSPAPGWSADGQRLKAPLDCSRGPDKAWVYGALRPHDGQTLTLMAPSRKLDRVEQPHPDGDLVLIADHLSSHTSAPIRDWLALHPQVESVPLPIGACWLNLIEGWWPLLRGEAFAGLRFANQTELETATQHATTRLNRRAHP